MNGVPDETEYNSALRYNAGTESAPELGIVEFAVSSFQRLVFRGGDQHDVVYGAVGDDVFHGGAGDDVLSGAAVTKGCSAATATIGWNWRVSAVPIWSGAGMGTTPS